MSVTEHEHWHFILLSRNEMFFDIPHSLQYIYTYSHLDITTSDHWPAASICCHPRIFRIDEHPGSHALSGDMSVYSSAIISPARCACWKLKISKKTMRLQLLLDIARRRPRSPRDQQHISITYLDVMSLVILFGLHFLACTAFLDSDAIKNTA